MAGIFKAYDIRGIASGDGAPLTSQRAYLIGRGLADGVFAGFSPICITHDMRTHSPALYGELGRGLRDGGCDVIEAGLVATPMNYWAINQYNARGGVQVTASHNGPEYNGFKVSGPGAAPLDYISGLNLVEAYVLNAERNGIPAPVENVGTQTTAENVLRDYLDWMNKFVQAGDKTLKIGIDGGNGMAGLFLPEFFASHETWQATPLFWELDGNFPNHEADPLKAENLVDVQKLVRDNSLDMGVAYDGDADRCMFVDENGDSISSDLITALIAGEILGEQPGAAILYDLRSSQVVPQWIQRTWRRALSRSRRPLVHETFDARKERDVWRRTVGPLLFRQLLQHRFGFDGDDQSVEFAVQFGQNSVAAHRATAALPRDRRN